MKFIQINQQELKDFFRNIEVQGNKEILIKIQYLIERKIEKM